MRLDKYISHVIDLSRKEVKRLLHAGCVTVDGEQVRDPGTIITEAMEVRLDGELLRPPRPRYFMLNKPKGYVCATTDPDHPTVLELLDEPNQDKLQIAGRLDIDTTGLVLITDDGKWNHAITSPRRDCKKIYYVTLASDISEDTGAQFAKGVKLDGELKPTLPAELQRVYSNEARLAIAEGKYHQVKRMFAAVGNHVEELHRESVGDIILDTRLELGEYRELTDAEIHSVRV